MVLCLILSLSMSPPMSPRSPRPRRNRREQEPAQLPLPAPPAKTRGPLTPEQAAKVAVSRRAKASTVPGHVKLVLTLDMERSLAEKLSARAVREGQNLDGVVVAILRAG